MKLNFVNSTLLKEVFESFLISDELKDDGEKMNNEYKK